LNLPAAEQTICLRCDGDDHTLSAARDGTGWRLTLGDASRHARAEPLPDGRLAVEFAGKRQLVRVIQQEGAVAVFLAGRSWRLDEIDPLAAPAGAAAMTGRLTAPMPGRVAQLLVAPGERVRQGQPVMVVEAMKMEHTIAAPRDGIIAAVHYRAGDLVEEGAALLALAESDDSSG
jgi:3-methylcrotonyl-CoA carboxylase alpha subunit